jgi:hypothetical protein
MHAGTHFGDKLDTGLRMNCKVSENSVLVSVGNGLTAEQEVFVAAVESMLNGHGLHPITLGRNMVSGENPLASVRAIVSATIGTLVIAFARLKIESAVEYPESPDSHPANRRIIPTVWNQIEAAMTYQADHPLLILVEAGLYHEGIIDPAIHDCLTFVPVLLGTDLQPELRTVIEHWIASLSRAH